MAPWREIPEPLGAAARDILQAYDLALDSAVSGGLGSPARIGLGYAEREACFRYHGISDPEAQEMLTECFDLIRASRAEGAAAGSAEKLEREKAERE